MMRQLTVLFSVLGALAPAAALAQTHAVKKPETVVRAVAVYEWTGDEAKPNASRLVPVSIFINSELRDAGLYLARPVPFALDRGNIFEGQKSGVPEGTLELAFQRHLIAASETPFDDGWTAYGVFKPMPKEAEYIAPKTMHPLPQVVASGGHPSLSGGSASSTTDDPDKPKMQRRDGSPSDTDSTASADSNKPVLQKRSDSGDASSNPVDSNKPVLQKRSDSSDTTPAAQTSDTTATAPPADDDPHRPVLTRRSDSGNASEQSSTTTSSNSTDDLDRPTLKKRTPAEAKNAKKKGDQASVTGVGSLNDDPDRPTLHRGTSSTPDIPPLNGLPADMRQMVAVSDAKDRPEHDFARPWDSANERHDVLVSMQETARATLAKYDMQPPAPPAPVAAPAPAPAKTTARTKRPVPAPAPPPPAPVALEEESLRGYTLSYGGAATFVYTATSPGTAGATRYVTVVAQKEQLGDIKVALTSVTDSTHLDRTPWMRFVDVVDAEASNRASLLFELRAQSARQFALYRVIGAQTEQIFATGTTQ